MDEIFVKLTKLINKKDNVIIIAHRGLDLDALGSSICLNSIIKDLGKNSYIFLNSKDEHQEIAKSLDTMFNYKMDIDFIDENYLDNFNDKNTLLVILDTHKQELLEYPEIINLYNSIAIIDHHIKSDDYIKKASFIHIDNHVSSTVEIMIDYLKYLNKTIDPIIATIMLAGMEVDTNGFNIKTNSKTYLSAAFLMEMGADNIEKQKLLKENKDKYCKRQEFIRKSYMITDDMALCVMDTNTYMRYELALISEELLQFDDVEASFTIGYIDKDTIGISARSIGKIDVENIMRKLGGGGHMTDAACSIKNETLKEVKEKLLDIVKR